MVGAMFDDNFSCLTAPARLSCWLGLISNPCFLPPPPSPSPSSTLPVARSVLDWEWGASGVCSRLVLLYFIYCFTTPFYTDNL